MRDAIEAAARADAALGTAYRRWSEWFDVPHDKAGVEVAAELHRLVLARLTEAKAAAEAARKFEAMPLGDPS